MMDSVSKSLLKQGLDSINQALLARRESQSTGEEVEYQPPTESEFAATVAKDMAGEVLSSRRMLWIAGIVIVIVILLVVYLMSRG
jgi:predicted RND superfamily exporter protein